MKQADRTKTCSNCEADVNYEATYCPFCGTDLLASSLSPKKEPLPQDEKFTSQSLQESLASLYKPPYSVRNRQGLGIPDEREEAVFKEVQPPKEDPLFYSYENFDKAEEKDKEEVVEEEVENTQRGGVLPLLVLSMGGFLFTLGALLLFFSKKGVLTLEWNARYWFLYCLIGIPFIGLGVRLLKKLTLRQET